MTGGSSSDKLMCMTVKQLKDLASKRKIEGRSKLTTKKQLVTALAR